MSEAEIKQYCVTVKVWVSAEDAIDAEELVKDDLKYLCGLDTPVSGFSVKKTEEDPEVKQP